MKFEGEDQLKVNLEIEKLKKTLSLKEEECVSIHWYIAGIPMTISLREAKRVEFLKVLATMRLNYTNSINKHRWTSWNSKELEVRNLSKYSNRVHQVYMDSFTVEDILKMVRKLKVASLLGEFRDE